MVLPIQAEGRVMSGSCVFNEVLQRTDPLELEQLYRIDGKSRDAPNRSLDAVKRVKSRFHRAEVGEVPAPNTGSVLGRKPAVNPNRAVLS